jgi:Biotin-lipoyl like/HlyD family secretion protein
VGIVTRAIGVSSATDPTGSRAPESPALRLLQYEADVRRLAGEPELMFHLANEVRALVPCHQVMVLRRHRNAKRLHIRQISGLPEVDRTAALVRAFEARIADFDSQGLLGAALPFEMALSSTVPAVRADHDALLAAHPIPHALWLPLKDRFDHVEAGALFMRAQPFSLGEQTVLQRLADTYAHAWSALSVRRRLSYGMAIGRTRLWVGAAVLAAAAMVPVHVSVMAPVEVIAARPVVVTAPIAGVVKTLRVAPNQRVETGQPLLQFEDIQPRNEMILAGQRLAVSTARYERLRALAFADATAGHELATARAEYELARVTHGYAVEVLRRTQVATPTAGVAVYTDRRDWEGRAVMVGEEIMQVADPEQVAFRVDLSTGNAIQLKAGADVDVFLDNAPFGGLPARVVSTSYVPRTLPGGDTSYTVIAEPSGGSVPRIGARGTARLYGERVPLAVQLLRRPIMALRQFLGL